MIMDKSDVVEVKRLMKAVGDRRKVKIYVTNGFQINAEIVDFDDVCIVVKEDGKEKLIYKSAISTIDLL